MGAVHLGLIHTPARVRMLQAAELLEAGPPTSSEDPAAHSSHFDLRDVYRLSRLVSIAAADVERQLPKPGAPKHYQQ